MPSEYFLYKIFMCLLLVPIFLLPEIGTESSSNSYVTDLCDWKGTTKSVAGTSEPSRSVVPIYLRCSTGTVRWFYPIGGLRVVLKLGTADKDFHGCIRVQRNTSRNARIYIEGRRQLLPLFDVNDGRHPDLFRCFVSVNHFLALFIETDDKSDHPQDPVVFQYDLQEIHHNSDDDDPLENCQPCSDQKILDLFCSAAFAITGRIIEHRDLPELELKEFLVKPYHLYRYRSNRSSAFINDFDMPTNSIDQLDRKMPRTILLNRSDRCPIGNIIRSTRNLFLGRQILGKFFVTCFTPLDHWKQISQRAIQEGTNQCHIN